MEVKREEWNGGSAVVYLDHADISMAIESYLKSNGVCFSGGGNFVIERSGAYIAMTADTRVEHNGKVIYQPPTARAE